jgi:transcriptional regulator with XRE-family HTH domain
MVDGGFDTPKNARMTTDERKRIGLRLRAMRVERGLDQAEVARRAKVAIGTLQSIENATRETRDSNFEKVARFFKTSLIELREGDRTVPPTDPLYSGLTKEDVRIARRYHDSETSVRNLAQRLLTGELSEAVINFAQRVISGDLAEAQLALADRIARLSSDRRTTLEELLEGLEDAERAESAKEQPRHRPTTKP